MFVYGLIKRTYSNINSPWLLANPPLPISKEYNHMCRLQNEFFRSNHGTEKMCDKGRKGYFGITGDGKCEITPVTFIDLYKK